MLGVGEYITQVLNPGIKRDDLAGVQLDQENTGEAVAQALSSSSVSRGDTAYDQDTTPEADRYGNMAVDTEKGFVRLQDSAYGGQRDMIAVAFESETDDGETREGILAVDDNGASARVYSDGEAICSTAVDEYVMDEINRLATDAWGYLAREEREQGDGAELQDKEYAVEMNDKVEKYRNKLDGSKTEMFDKTLVNLAEEPYKRARKIIEGGRGVYHAVDHDERVLARVDEESKTVNVYFAGDHDDMKGIAQQTGEGKLT